MTAAAHAPSDVEAYLARVRDALADVPAEERNELLAEVEASLYETASESGGSVAARLGPPEDFAAELRSAAGLHEAPPAREPGLAATFGRLLADRRVAHALRTARELAPIWWAVRGYLAVAVLALIFGSSWSVAHGAVPRIGSAPVGLACIVIAIAASIALGLWTRGRDGSRAVALLNVALLVAVIPVAQHLSRGTPTQVSLVTVPQIQPGLAYDGAPVTNIYPYSRDGKLLHDVLLYTGTGRPLDVSPLGYDPNRRIVRARDGRKLLNVFPLRYYQPGTRTVRNPNAHPKIKVPHVATRPLRRR